MSVRDLETYEVIKEEDLTGIQSKGTLLRHKKSGARVLLIENEDNNKVFSIGFRTPPADSTGVPRAVRVTELPGQGSLCGAGEGVTEYISQCHDLPG